MKTLVLATANVHKASEIRALLPPGFELKSLSDVGIYEEIPEPGDTIRENSFLKASYVSNKLAQESFWVMADDSGLEVAALGNRPGVHSAMYAGLPKNNDANNRKLLEELKNVGERKARLVTVITLIADGKTHVFEGWVEGTIAHEPRGNNGFGYDPLFIPQGYRSTFAELGAELKNQISHRAAATKQLIDYLVKM